MQKRIPTLLGMVVLVIALLIGLLFFGDGVGVFAPRASPQTTPKQVRLTNVTDSSFTVSFYTDEMTVGFLRYGESVNQIKFQAGDDRNELSGLLDKHNLHHITVKGLKPSTAYYYLLGTGSSSTFDNQGTPFQVTTAKKISAPPPANKTIYGNVVNTVNTPAEGSIVYLRSEGASDMSVLVRQSGSWALALANLRKIDGSDYLAVDDSTKISLFVQGPVLNQTASVELTVSQAQPVKTLSLVAGGSSANIATNSIQTDSASNTSVVDTKQEQLTDAQSLGGDQVRTIDQTVPDNSFSKTNLADFTDWQSSQSAEIALDDEQLVNTASESSELTDTLSSSASATPTQLPTQSPTQLPTQSPTQILTQSPTPTAVDQLATRQDTQVLDLQSTDNTDKPTLNTQVPLIVGRAPANVRVKISVHSETQIVQEVQADSNGFFELDLAQFSQGLEPGEHTVSYSYVDPITGQEVTKTQKFVVQASNDEHLLASNSLTNQGSVNSVTDETNVAIKSQNQSNIDNPGELIASNNVPYGSGNPYPLRTITPVLNTSPTPTKVASRSAVVATNSGVYRSGSVSLTINLVLAGVFFVLMGGWSWWLASQLLEAEKK